MPVLDKAIAAYLKGFEAEWRDTDDLRSPHPWDEQLVAAIKRADAAIAIFTPHAVRTGRGRWRLSGRKRACRLSARSPEGPRAAGAGAVTADAECHGLRLSGPSIRRHRGPVRRHCGKSPQARVFSSITSTTCAEAGRNQIANY